MPVLYEDMTLSSAGKPAALIPAPIVSISKDYIKTSDGKKIGATYRITLKGTILPDRGSPTAGGAIAGDAQVPLFYQNRDGAPGTSSIYHSQSVTGDLSQRSLMMKSQAIRRLFSIEGRKLSILTWKSGNPGIFCFPRVQSISMDDGRYADSLPYTIQLECDEIFIDTGTDGSSTTLVGQEDLHNAGVNITQEGGQSFDSDFISPVGDITGNVNVYLSNASETWATNNQDKGFMWYDSQLKDDFADSKTAALKYLRENVYAVTHTVSATGKRAYGEDGLIREPWENAKIWVESRIGPNPKDDSGKEARPNDYIDPSDTTKIFNYYRNGWDWEEGYFPDSVSSDAKHTEWTPHGWSRTGEIDRTSGSYTITETFTMIPGYARNNGDLQNKSVTEDIKIDFSEDLDNDIKTVTVNGTITGHDVVSTNSGGDISKINVTAASNAKERWTTLTSKTSDKSPIYRIAVTDFLSDSSSSDIDSEAISKNVSINETEGVITFSYVFNNRRDNIGLPLGVGIDKPISSSIVVTDTKGTSQFASHLVPGRRQGSVLQNLETPSMPSRTVSINIKFHPSTNSTQQSAAINKIVSKINDYTPGSTTTGTAVAVYFKTADNREWDPISDTYSRTVTWKYQEEI
tara:strand:+ start:683 stop:2575 length:1893 start_codon:yes stop_codon:yes gene_type:complete